MIACLLIYVKFVQQVRTDWNHIVEEISQFAGIYQRSLARAKAI